MKPTIAVIDYGMGNLRSVAKALEKAGALVQVTDSPAIVKKAQGVVLPGVGAFGEASRRLKSTGLDKVIRASLASDKPFLGICLGLQLLFESSEESPKAKGLGFWKGKVKRFRFSPAGLGACLPAGRHSGAPYKVPHMGWNTVTQSRDPNSGSKNILKGITGKDYFYFVHSYYPVPKDRDVIALETHYGKSFCSAASQGRVFACQFHPEKSGAQGQRILKNFVKEVASC